MKTLKIFLSEITRPRALVFGVASSSGPLPNLFKLCPWGQKWSRPQGYMFLHSRENMKKSCLKQQGIQ